MSLFLFHVFPSSQPPKLLCKFNSFKTQLPLKRSTISCSTIPARDRVIDFGRHKGKMLGTLPSKYLKWVSNNLITQDFQHWGKLADEVLQDPIYKDRIEWEFAENLLTGDHGSSSLGRTNTVGELMEFSERFGWDNDDMIGWSRIDFSLLGTSKGGRIPRKGDAKSGKVESLESRKMREEVGGKREVRIERQRLKRGVKMDSLEEKCDIDDENKKEMGNKVASSPFPGREALLKKVFDRRREL